MSDREQQVRAVRFVPEGMGVLKSFLFNTPMPFFVFVVHKVQRSVNRYFDERQASAGRQMVQLLDGLESEAYGRQQTALGNQQASLGGLMSLLGNQQSQWQQQEEARYGNQVETLSGLGQVAGYLWGNKKP